MATNVLDIEPPIQEAKESHSRSIWLKKVWTRIKKGPFPIMAYTVATLPAATSWGDGSVWSSVVMVTDDATYGKCLAFSDGSVWKAVNAPTHTIA